MKSETKTCQNCQPEADPPWADKNQFTIEPEPFGFAQDFASI